MEEAINRIEQLMIRLSDSERNMWSKKEINEIQDELVEVWQILNGVSIQSQKD